MLRNSQNTHPYHNYVELSNEADLFIKSKSEEKLDRKFSLFFSTEFFMSEITGRKYEIDTYVKTYSQVQANTFHLEIGFFFH